MRRVIITMMMVLIHACITSHHMKQDLGWTDQMEHDTHACGTTKMDVIFHLYPP